MDALQLRLLPFRDQGRSVGVVRLFGRRFLVWSLIVTAASSGNRSLTALADVRLLDSIASSNTFLESCHMSDQLLQRLGRLLLLCCVLAVGTVTGWGSFAYMAWSVRDLSKEVSALTAERNQLLHQRNVMGAELEQLQRSERERANPETRIPAARVAAARRTSGERGSQGRHHGAHKAQARSRARRRFSNWQHLATGAEAVTPLISSPDKRVQHRRPRSCDSIMEATAGEFAYFKAHGNR